MKVFFDCEFNGLRQHTQLISIGVVDEHDNTFYAEIVPNKAFIVEPWVLENVMPHLKFRDLSVGFHFEEYNGSVNMLGDMREVGEELRKWLEPHKTVEIWSDCLAYDWVLFCELFGGALNIPSNVYYIPFDICTVFKIKGVDPDVHREKFAGASDAKKKHNALWDAIVIKNCYYKLLTMGG